MEAQLGDLTGGEIGDLGEEIVRLHLEDAGAVIVALGDAHLERTHGRQDLDILAIIDGELTAVEVKTRYHSKLAGTFGRSGDLRRPKLRRSRLKLDGTISPAQSSSEYVGTRAESFLDRLDGKLESRVYLVDLVAMALQWFPVDSLGRMFDAPEPPVGCESEFDIAWGVFSGR